MAGAVRLLYLYNNQLLTAAFPPRPTHDELLAEINRWPSLRDSLVVRGWCRKVLTPSVTVFFHFVFARIDPIAANTFFAKLGAGDDLTKDSPIYCLRERLLDARHEGKRLLATELYALVIKAWNAFVRGHVLRRLTWNAHEPFPTVAERRRKVG